MSQPTRIRELRTRRSAGARALRGLDRDARAPALLDAPAAAGARMHALRVAVVGLGSIGSYFADLLARATVASLVLVDGARIKPESVLTHPVHPRDIGRPKATLAGERAKAVSPATRVYVSDGPVEELPLDAFVDASAVLLASDNLACELEVSRRCLRLGVPLIQASVHGATLVAQVRSLVHAVGDDGPGLGPGLGPCLACGYQAADWEALDRGTRFSCAGGPALRTAVPTASPAQLCAMAASLAVTELMGRTSGILPASGSRLIEYCGFTHKTTLTPLARSSACPCDHTPWRVAAWPRPLGAATPRELLAAAGCSADSAHAEVSMNVAGYRFSRLGACACSRHPVLDRFRPLSSDPGSCPSCASPLEAHPFYTHETVPGVALRSILDRPLGEVGAPAPATVLVRRSSDAVLFHAPRSVSR